MNIQIKDFTFSQYFVLLEILNKDQFEYKEDAKTGKITKGKAVKKSERTEEFLFELYREIVKQATGLSSQYIQDDSFIVICWDLIHQKLEQINELIASDSDEDINEIFDFDGKKIAFSDFKEWTFNKWVVLENASKGITAQQGNEIKIIEHGAKFILPICFGEWVDSMPDFEQKFDFFNNKMAAKDMAFVFAKVNNRINALKKAHGAMYSSEESSSGGRNYKLHVDLFGWQETLRDLGERRVFGNYLETKQAPLLEVLEYLNCKVSAEIAKDKDFEIANKKYK